MPVYVDNFNVSAQVGSIRGVWCHMTADTTEELVRMATEIGLNPAWIQYPGRWNEHFDVTATKRRLAVKLGAVEVGALDGVRAMRKRWNDRQAGIVAEAVVEEPKDEPGGELSLWD